MLLAPLLAAAIAVPTTVAADVAELSTRVCYALASGILTMPTGSGPAVLEAQNKLLEAQGVMVGLDKAAFDGLGLAGSAMVSQSIMGARANGTARTVLAIGGRMQGCRTMLAADTDSGVGPAVAKALTAQGWREDASLVATRGPLERRAFLRRDRAGKPYLLNLMTLTAASPETGRLRLFTSVAAIPPGVTLPKGF